MALKDLFSFRKKIIDRPVPNPKWSAPSKTYTPVRNLEIGMFVIELDRPWLETDFFFQGFEIKTEKEIKQLREICEYVYIETTVLRNPSPVAHYKSAPASNKNLKSSHTPPQKPSNFEDNVQNAKDTYYATGQLISDFMDRVANGDGRVDAKEAKLAVAECVNSVLCSPDAAVWLSQLKSKSHYTAQHSLNVCVLSIVLGQHMKLSEANLNTLGLCGLLHDVGKMRIPRDILNKPAKLDPDEKRLMRKHTVLGYELLKSCDGMVADVINTAHEHHERIDGKGYPNNISGTKLSLYSKIVSIADMYDAITSDRVYQKGRTHLEATKALYDLSGRHLDGALTMTFIESLGVYPPGCFVSFTNGAIGQVVESNAANKLHPKIKLILDEEKNSASNKKIDLSLMPKDILGRAYTIKRIIKAKDYNIDPAKFYLDGVLLTGFAKGILETSLQPA